jgi:hypothetical protein
MRRATCVMSLVSVLILGGVIASAWALGPGAPPKINYANVEVVTTGLGSPRLWLSVGVEIPGGNVPLNVQGVTGTLPFPDGRTFTLPLDRSDLVAEQAYFLDLTSAGVVGFPPGTYTFAVSDTAGGVSTATDDLASTTGLPASTSISVSGLESVPANNGVVNLLSLATNPTPTISWTAVPGAATHRVRVRGGFQDLDLFSRYTGGATSITLPAGVMVPGRRYLVRVDAYDHLNGAGCSTPPYTCQDANARSRQSIEVVTKGPEIFLTFNSGTYTAGQTLDVTTRIYNTGPSVTVNVTAWIGLPTGAVIPILNLSNLAIPNSTLTPSGPNNFYSGSIGFSYTFTGSEPSGAYLVGLRLIDPATGETVALATRAFSK